MFDNSFIKKKLENDIALKRTGVKNKTLWTSEKVAECVIEIADGIVRQDNPFVKGNISKRKPNIPFQYTKEELTEMENCYKDVVYFAEKYCQVVTDDGVMKVKMRDYQENMLYNFQKNRFNIMLASRQIGKCVDYNTTITIQNGSTGEIFEVTLGDFYYRMKQKDTKLPILEQIKLYLIRKVAEYEINL